MSNNYEDYKPLNPLPPRRRRSKFVAFTQGLVIVILVIAIAGSAAFFVMTHKNSQQTGGYPEDVPTNTTPETETDAPEQTGKPDESGSENDVNTPPAYEYKAVEVSNEEVHTGTLAYLSGLYKAVYPTNAELTRIYGKTEGAYMLSSADIVVRADMIPQFNAFIKAFTEATGKGDIVVWTGYRTEERQQQVYDDYVKLHGEDAAAGNVAKPGESDHHTGYTIGIKVKSNQGYKAPQEVEGYEWLVENCYKFGFIERYPSDKVSTTGMKYDAALCLRYVGAPHAEIMKQKNMCLEDYLTFIKDFKYDGTHFDLTSEDGTSYGVYFCPENTELENTLVNVPKESEFSIVGNNMDGFVVAFKK